MEPVLLATVAHRFADGPAEDLDRAEARQHGAGPERFDQRDDLINARLCHRRIPSVDGAGCLTTPGPSWTLNHRAGRAKGLAALQRGGPGAAGFGSGQVRSTGFVRFVAGEVVHASVVSAGLSSALVVAAGCGQESYNKRLDATLARLERERRIAKNLMPPRPTRSSRSCRSTSGRPRTRRRPRPASCRWVRGSSNSTPRSSTRPTPRCTCWRGSSCPRSARPRGPHRAGAGGRGVTSRATSSARPGQQFGRWKGSRPQVRRREQAGEPVQAPGRDRQRQGESSSTPTSKTTTMWP